MASAALFGCARAAAPPAPPLPPAPIPAELTAFLGTNCVSCHDANHRVPLVPPPARSDAEGWARISRAIGSGAMPPPIPGFPSEIDPGTRDDVVARIDRMVERPAPATPPPHVQDIPLEAWLDALERAAAPYLDARGVDRIAREHLGGLGGQRMATEKHARNGNGDFTYAVGLMNRNLIGCEVCTALVDGELAKPQSSRVVFADVRLDAASPTEPEIRAITCRLSRHVFQEECTREDEDEGVRMYRTFQPMTRTTRATTIAVCTAYLAGPRLLVEVASANAPPVQRQ